MSWRTQRVPYADVTRLEEALGCPEPIAWILARRGLADPLDARAFLDAGDPAVALLPPESIPGIAEAADRLVEAIRRNERIVVHGDYDCDGITSTALLVGALRARGAQVRPFLPSRFTDGYGVREQTIERLADEGCDVLVCVDCGTTAVEPLTRAVELGIAPIVCDHHLAAGARPPAILANPALGRGEEVLPAAAGVVFALTRALSARLDGDRLGPDREEGIDLVALATVADAVPLVGENRRLVARGLSVLRTAPRPGLAALCRAASVAPRALNARHLGFTLAPCLNAAGRMAHPDRGLELLLADDPSRLSALAEELWSLNLERRDVERRIVAEAIEMVMAAPAEQSEADTLVVAGAGWHEGVVGIVASRLVERFARPAIVISLLGDRAKGSGRSLPGVDLHALVGAASARLSRWGGHQGAVGLELAAADVGYFRAALAEAAVGVRGAIERARVRVVDAVVPAGGLSLALAEEIARLAPFGRGNPDVRLAVPACEIGRLSRVGEDGRHLEVRIASGGAQARAIGFGLGHRHDQIDVAARHDAIVRLEVDRYQELVGTRVTLEALEPVVAAAPKGLCSQACDVACSERDRLTPDLLQACLEPQPPFPAAAGHPRAIRDRRGRGGVALIAALASADQGAVLVVSDVARRRAALAGVLAPSRLGVEVAALGGVRCDAGGVRARVETTRGGPILAMIEYASLPQVELPAEAHVVLVDPPATPADAAWALWRADGRWLHVAWDEDAVDVARQVVEERLDVRQAASLVWRGLADGQPRRFGPQLDRVALGDGAVMVAPIVAARGIAALRQLGLVEVGDDGVRALLPAARRDLAESPLYRALAERLDEARAFLDQAMSLDLSAGARHEAVPALV